MIIINKSKSGERLGKRGVAFIIAILISSVALAVGLGVYNRTYKQLLLGSFWKQTQVAFSAAGSGLECAKYWDAKGSGSPSCFGIDITGWVPGNGGSFSATVAGGCVSVTIDKQSAGTTFTSVGSNDKCDSSNPRRVERVLEFWSPNP